MVHHGKALERDPSCGPALRGRGIAFYHLHDFQKASRDLQKALAIDPELPDVRRYAQMAIEKLGS